MDGRNTFRENRILGDKGHYVAPSESRVSSGTYVSRASISMKKKNIGLSSVDCDGDNQTS
jgi:hypothetical protein